MKEEEKSFFVQVRTLYVFCSSINFCQICDRVTRVLPLNGDDRRRYPPYSPLLDENMNYVPSFMCHSDPIPSSSSFDGAQGRVRYANTCGCCRVQMFFLRRAFFQILILKLEVLRPSLSHRSLQSMWKEKLQMQRCSK